LAVPADTTFVVKLHFSDPDNYSRSLLRRVMALPGLRIAHPNASGRDFIERAAMVVGIHGTSSLEAALLGKRVLLFGESPYLNFPRTERPVRPQDLDRQIRRMLQLPPATDDEIQEAFARYISRYRPGRTNDWTRQIEDQEIDRFSECFEALRDYLADAANRSGWYHTPPFSDSQN
jgi:hypothetical protein